MKPNARSGSRLFFLEFLIVLFFFLIISTVCLQLFAGAHKITGRSEALSHAQAAAASVAAVLEAGHTSPEDAASYFTDAIVTEDGFCVEYDRNFSVCGPDLATESTAYRMEVCMKRGDHRLQADICFRDREGRTLYELPLTLHLPQTRKEILP